MSGKIRVLIVDDSAFARFSISKQISGDSEIEIVDTAHDGVDALDKIKKLKPDVVTLDVEMPRMDGLTALGHIMSDYPTPVVMLSSLTGEGTETTLRALDMGAVDFFLKPSPTAPAGIDDGVVGDLVEKIRAASRISISQLRAMARSKRTVSATKLASPKRRALSQRRVVIIGCSTGGPRALNELLPMIPGDLPAAILVVQHMPMGFTKSLAARLNEVAEFEVREADVGDVISPGLALFAPGGYHMLVDPSGHISLNRGPQECGLRPAVNTTMESAAQSYGRFTLGVVLTGMGNDGTRGAAQIRGAGGEVIVEDESTCVIYGMPKSVIEAGFADKVLPLSEIAGEIAKRCSGLIKV